jgi:hypothetical protein
VFKIKGAQVLVLIHLALFPESIKSYGLSILDISVWLFIWTKLLGSLPIGVCVFIHCITKAIDAILIVHPHTVSFLAYTGATSRDIIAVLNNEKKMGTGEIVLLVTGLVAFVVVLLVIGYHVQRQMKRQMKGIEGGVDESGASAANRTRVFGETPRNQVLQAQQLNTNGSSSSGGAGSGGDSVVNSAALAVRAIQQQKQQSELGGDNVAALEEIYCPIEDRRGGNRYSSGSTWQVGRPTTTPVGRPTSTPVVL